MTAPIRLAIVGMGKITHDQHMPAIAEKRSFELVATVDHGKCEDHGVAAFGSIEQLVASGLEVDAVAINTPPQVRHDIAQTALANDWHVLLEKPPGATLAEVVALRDFATEKELTLFATWHSRYARMVEPARKWLSGREILSANITWREDVRVWHPGQHWIWQPGGFGVFDPGINALSIITHILPDPMFVVESDLFIPANRFAPIAAHIGFRSRGGIPVKLDLDFRQEGQQSWDIEIETDAGCMRLSQGGAVLSIAGEPRDLPDGELHGEYPSIYSRFAALIRAGISEVDVSPLRLVADAFLCARMTMVDEFHD